MSFTDFLTGLSVVVSGLAALLAGYYSRRSIAYSKKSEDAAQLANSHADHSNVISANAWLDQYLVNLRSWADDACESISRAIHTTHLDSDKRSHELFECMYRLSASIDRGRWFFPNQWNAKIGLDKEPAYRGLRQPILDELVAAYDIVKKMNVTPGLNPVAQLVHCQRSFVSEVQQVLNPRRRAEEMDRVNKQFAISEKLAELKREESDLTNG
jgi:hypothetical protein